MTVTPVPRDQRSLIVKLTQVVWLLFGVLEALIGLRVVLKLIAANPNSPFAVLVYRLSGLFVWPFSGLTRTPAAGGMVLDIPSIIAMLVYALVAWVIVRLIWIVLDRPGAPAVVSQTTVVHETTPLSTTTQTTTTNNGLNRGP
ncbi:MAG: YggT family protein [Anaerolineales bacterium]